MTLFKMSLSGDAGKNTVYVCMCICMDAKGDGNMVNEHKILIKCLK